MSESEPSENTGRAKRLGTIYMASGVAMSVMMLPILGFCIAFGLAAGLRGDWPSWANTTTQVLIVIDIFPMTLFYGSGLLGLLANRRHRQRSSKW